jgi:hypothetical protein
MKKAFLFLALLVVAFSCNLFDTRDHTIWVYKTKGDYANNVPVQLSADKTRIVGSPASINTRWPVSLVDDFLLNGSGGPNSGYLSITIEEWNQMDITPSVDSLNKFLIDTDPFIRFYHRDDKNNFFWTKNGAYGIDTAHLNLLIRNNQLEKYFKRLK